jgi:hypothetical protein
LFRLLAGKALAAMAQPHAPALLMANTLHQIFLYGGRWLIFGEKETQWHHML